MAFLRTFFDFRVSALTRLSLLVSVHLAMITLICACATGNTRTTEKAHSGDKKARHPALDHEKADRNAARLSILQGVTSATETQVSILVPADTHLDIGLWNDGRRIIEKSRSVLSESDLFPDRESQWSVINIAYAGLRPNVTYQLRVLELGKNGSVERDGRELRTLDPSLTNPKIALISCMNDKYGYDAIYPIWNKLQDERSHPDLIFLLGDNVYVDAEPGPPSARTIWNRYVEARQEFPVYKMTQLIPTVATWDDHDYGYNDMGKDFEFKELATRVFAGFFAQEPIPGVYEPAKNRSGQPIGIAAVLHIYGTDYFFMDGRSFRDTARSGGHLWGREQEQWLERELKTADRPAWIINGSQYFGKYHNGESYEREYSRNFESWFLPLVRRTPRPIVLVSGDRHMSEVMNLTDDIGYPTYELSSSGIHSYVLYGDRPPDANFRRLPDDNGTKYVADHNFMVVELKEQNSARTQSMGLTVWGLAAEPLYQIKNLTIGPR